MGEASGWCWLALRCACRSLRFGISPLAVLSSLGCIKDFLHLSSENDADGRRRRRLRGEIHFNEYYRGKRRRELYENLFEISAIKYNYYFTFFCTRLFFLPAAYCQVPLHTASHYHQLCTATVPHRHTYDPICFRPSMSANERNLRSNNAREPEDCNWTAGH